MFGNTSCCRLTSTLIQFRNIPGTHAPKDKRLGSLHNQTSLASVCALSCLPRRLVFVRLPFSQKKFLSTGHKQAVTRRWNVFFLVCLGCTEQMLTFLELVSRCFFAWIVHRRVAVLDSATATMVKLAKSPAFFSSHCVLKTRRSGSIYGTALH